MTVCLVVARRTHVLTHIFLEPLYVVGAADLGTHAEALDNNLTSILKVSAIWGAVVLIDEADVFLEERTLAHLERNAMVAVFLRQLEWAFTLCIIV